MDRSSQPLLHRLGQFVLIWGFFVQSSNLLPFILLITYNLLYQSDFASNFAKIQAGGKA